MEHAVETYFMDSTTDGTFQAVTIPAGGDGRKFVIQVHDGGSTSYDVDSNCVGFQFSHDPDGSDGFIIVPPAGYGFPGCFSVGDVIGYVKAAAGNKIVLNVRQ
jgi:hypothetical protein